MATASVPAVDLGASYIRRHLEHQTSIVDDLLFEIYDRWQDGRHDSFESDTFTECSSTSEVSHWRRNSIYSDTNNSGRLSQAVLETQSKVHLRKMVSEMQHRVNSMSSRLVRQLKRRDRRCAKLQHNCDLVTAILQASSQKRRIDTRMRFSLEPPPGDSAFEQWKDAMKAVARLPMGIPDSFRRKVWLSLADNHFKELRIDWERTVRFAFNERSNPDDNTLGLQIVKDLHRTGCSGFSGQDNDEDRAVLKRVLLGYARWNKAVGYCQGFNVIAALLLEVMDRKEEDALKVMIYLIDHVLPESYYANNLRALSVDMAVFRDLLRVTFPKLSRHLDYLQHAAQDVNTGACYEPPLTNVFTMQWFLTMFATCLPKDIVLRVWDSVLLEGSEILLRTALAIWGKLSRRILSLSSADEFYSLMGVLTQEMMEGRMFDADSLIKFIYNCAPIPMQQLPELREKYTYNIRPFTSAAAGNKKSSLLGNMLPSDEDDLDEEDLEAITCFTGIIPGQVGAGRLRGPDGESGGSMADISMVGPGAYGMGSDSNIATDSSALMERMSTDIAALKKQYSRLKQRQNQAHIIIAAASAKQKAKVKAIVPKIETPTAMNHLYVGKKANPSTLQTKNRYVTASPRMVYPKAVTVPHFLQEGKKQTSPSHKEKGSESRSPSHKEKGSESRSPSKIEKGSENVSPIHKEKESGNVSPSHKEKGTENVFLSHMESSENVSSSHMERSENASPTLREKENLILQALDSTSKVTFAEETVVLKSENEASTDRICEEEITGHTHAEQDNSGESQSDGLTSHIEDIESDHECEAYSSVQQSADVNNLNLDSEIYIRGSGNVNNNSLMRKSPVEVEEELRSDSEDSGIIDNSEFQSVVEMGDDDIVVTYDGEECGEPRMLLRGEEWSRYREGEGSSKIIHSDQRQAIVQSKKTADDGREGCNFSEGETLNALSSEKKTRDIDKVVQMSNTSGAVKHEKDKVDNTQNQASDNQAKNIPDHLNLDCDLSKKDTTENLPKSDDKTFNYSQGTPLKSCLKSRSSSSPGQSMSGGGNPRKMKLPKEKLINLTEYAKSKRKMSSCSQESESPKHVTDSDSGSIFSPDENDSSKSFTYSDKSDSKPAKSVSWDSKLPPGLKPLGTKKPFNPFPVSHFNENRARTGIKLGIYTSSTFNELDKQSKKRPLWSK